MPTRVSTAATPTTDYILYWTSPEIARQIAPNTDAIRKLPLPYRCVERDEALGHARLRRQAGMVAMMIEGSGGILIDRAGIERELKVRAEELRDRPRIR